MPQRDAGHLSGPCPVRAGRLAVRLQHGQATLKLGGKTPAEIAGQRVWGHARRHVAILSNTHHEVLCSQETGPLLVRVSSIFEPGWRRQMDASIEVHGRAKCVHYQAG